MVSEETFDSVDHSKNMSVCAGFTECFYRAVKTRVDNGGWSAGLSDYKIFHKILQSELIYAGCHETSWQMPPQFIVPPESSGRKKPKILHTDIIKKGKWKINHLFLSRGHV